VIAGPPSPAGEDPVHRLPTDDRIEVLGEVSEAQRLELLGSAAVVACASVIEAFGITTLEAWAHATPVVVADTPVRRSVVRHGVDGLIAPRDAGGLAGAIIELLADPARARAMGEAGRRRVESEFRWHDIVARLVDFMQRL
jgi:glycosyltransferase involved in cell wall biosynthesis